jgi:hypothetical protein
MDLSKITKGLFAVKQKEAQQQDKEENQPTQLKEKIEYQEYGFQQAGKLGGTLAGLKVCLQKIFREFREEVRLDNEQQEVLKKPYRVKIEEYKGHNNTLEARIEKVKSDDIPACNSKIDRLREELSRIRQNPEEIIGDDAGKASFFIGGIILMFLTVYLFIFYSSASYSAFFKQFTMNDIGVTSSIFDAQAITEALKDGFTELLLILTIPFVFLGLGYLIHKFQEKKGIKKYLNIIALVIITFLFDAILAYQITERIYNIHKSNSFDTMPDYSFSLAFNSMNFWMIIFAGFIVYLIWGFVFDFTMEAYGKIDKVKVALREKQLRISEAEVNLKDLQVQIDKMNYTINDNIKEMNKLNRIVEASILPREFQYDIFSFMAGWLAWMKGSNKTHEDLNAAEETVNEFVKTTLLGIDII